MCLCCSSDIPEIGCTTLFCLQFLHCYGIDTFHYIPGTPTTECVSQTGFIWRLGDDVIFPLDNSEFTARPAEPQATEGLEDQYYEYEDPEYYYEYYYEDDSDTSIVNVGADESNVLGNQNLN